MVTKIAIPSNGDLVDAHFGRALAFTVFEIEGNQARQSEVLDTENLRHQHEGLAGLFKHHNIDALVCGGIGQGMIDSLNFYGLDVVTGASGKVKDVAQSYAEGTLVSTGSVCQEHHHH